MTERARKKEKHGSWRKGSVNSCIPSRIHINDKSHGKILANMTGSAITDEGARAAIATDMRIGTDHQEKGGQRSSTVIEPEIETFKMIGGEDHGIAVAAQQIDINERPKALL